MGTLSINRMLSNNDLRIVYVAILVILSAQLGFALQFDDSNTLAIWPPVGVSFALVLLLGYKIWPGLFIGGLISYSISFINQDIVISVSSISAISLITFGIVLEVLLGFFIYKKIIREGTPYEKTSNAFKFLLLSLVVCLIGAATYTGSLQMIGAVEKTELPEIFFTNYLGSVTGLLLFTNVILAWIKGKNHWKYSHRRLAEAIGFTGGIITILYLLNSNSLTLAFERSFPFLIIPFLLWAAFNANIQTAMTFVVLISLFSTYITQSDSGPFLLGDIQDSMFLLQIFIGVITISTIILSASVFERTTAKNKIEAFNETLESEVEKRTKELDEEIKIRKKSEKEIRKTNDELRKINYELDNFVYKVSHDLRAPISSILGLVNVARHDTSKVTLKACIDQIEKSAKTQDNFIKDILELSKNSHLEISREKIDFNEIVDETYKQLEHSYNGKTIKPRVKLNQKKPFYSDRTRLQIIFNNLISNAIKYGKEKNSKIDVGIDVSNSSANIRIKDNGIGIEKDHQEKVFDMFYRATDQNAGSGLGLYVVKETVTRLKGEITMVSEPEKGTEVNVKLPNS